MWPLVELASAVAYILLLLSFSCLQLPVSLQGSYYSHHILGAWGQKHCHDHNTCYTFTEGPEGGSPVWAPNILWMITDCLFSWPQPWNWQHFPAPYPLVACERPRLSHQARTKAIQSSLACSLCVIHVQAICGGTRNGVLSWVPCKMKQFCWKVIRNSIGVNACIFSTCTIWA